MKKMAFGLTGASNSGKTTLMESLIQWFRKKGYSVSSIKHAHHGFDIDRPGKDSYRMREAGAGEVLLVGNQRSVLMREFENGTEPSLEDLIKSLAPCDLVLVEGFKDSPIPKIEVFRPELGKAPLWPYFPSIVAVASNVDISCPLDVLDLSRPEQIAEFIESQIFTKIFTNKTDVMPSA